MTKPALGDLTASLGYDLLRVWASSFTVDEHEAFAIVYRALGGRVPTEGVRLTFHRHGFRRAGQGVMPRRWLKPFNVPSEAPLPTYHPKLILAETSERRHVLFVSTANLATDDLRQSVNLTVGLNVSPSLAKRVARWIDHPPEKHRALCLQVGDRSCQMISPGRNRSTLEQVASRLERCKRCASTARCGEWIVAAPFWSPATISELLRREKNGRIEAYFRIRTVWDQVAAALHNRPEETERVVAYELRNTAGHTARWHHKVLGWRCCNRPGARSALYLGSANATVCGLIGKGEAINWEAGALWLGGAELWRHARDVARGGLTAFALGRPRKTDVGAPKTDDELGAAETEELRRVFSAFASRCVRVERSSREVTRSTRADLAVRALGRRWHLDSLEVRIEQQNQVRDLGRLKAGRPIRVPQNGRAQIRAVFKIEAGAMADGPGFAETTIDLWELDPEPTRLRATPKSSIEAALVGLIGGAWSSGGGGATEQSTAGAPSPLDVRFPFAHYFSLQDRRPAAAHAWLDRLVHSKEPALAQLPTHWREIAKALRAQ
jgi:hypothetical protein